MSFNCKNFFLTYPHCDVSPQDLLDHLCSLSTARGLPLPFIYARVCRELHQDGQPHLHALLCLEKHYRAAANFFDFQGCHCNIQGARSISAVRDYLAKDGEYVEAGVAPTTAAKRTYADLLSSSSCKEDFLQGVTTEYTRDMVLNHERIIAFADYHWKPKPVPYEPQFTQFLVPEQLAAWHAGSLVGPFAQGQRRLSLILISPSRFGKTEWARSLGPHLYFNGMFDLSRFHSDVSYAVFDDFPWDSFSKFHKCWLGAQREFTLTDKYRRKQTVLWGKPSIFLCNDDNVPPSSDWILANCVYVRLNLPLF